MKHLFFFLLFFFFLLALGFSNPLTSFAQTPPISGIIFDSNNQPVSNTEITFLDPKTHKVIGKKTTGINGEYTISIPQGTYDVTYTPPSGSGFQSQTLRGQEVSLDKKNNFSFPPAINSPASQAKIPLIIFIFGGMLLLVVLLIGYFSWVKSKK